MAYQQKKPMWPWRDHLTDDEADRVRFLENHIAKMDERRREMAAELGPIRNRAIHRAKQAKQRDAA